MTGIDLSGLVVSRETTVGLEAYVENLLRWNAKINLVSRSTEAEVWTRHIADSAQVMALAIKDNLSGHWVDVGSGGGLPGLVLAILAREYQPESRFTLVESDKRKAAFLADTSQRLGLRAQIRSERIEKVDPLGADILTARAFAPLPRLLELCHRHLSDGAVALLLKGESYLDEVTDAKKSWNFSVQDTISATNSASRLIKLGGIGHA